MKTAEKLFKEAMIDKAFSKWFYERPIKIQWMIKKYPPGVKYRIRSDAPYGITGPGCLVQIVSYHESGDVNVCVFPKDRTKASIDFEQNLIILHNRVGMTAGARPMSAYVDPAYLELTDVSEDE